MQSAFNDPPPGLHLVKPLASRQRPLVLVVDHHEDTRSMLRTMLTMDGFDVAESDSGEEAVASATKLRPDVILLDGTMRTAEGLTVAKRLQQADVAPGARIVFVSGHGGRALERSAYAAGCDSFLLKPMDFEQLRRVVRRLATPGTHEAR